MSVLFFTSGSTGYSNARECLSYLSKKASNYGDVPETASQVTLPVFASVLAVVLALVLTGVLVIVLTKALAFVNAVRSVNVCVLMILNIPFVKTITG